MNLDGAGLDELVIAADSALYILRADGSPFFASGPRVGGRLPGRVLGEVAATERFFWGEPFPNLSSWIALGIEGRGIAIADTSGSIFSEPATVPLATTGPVFPWSAGADPVVRRSVARRSDGSLTVFPALAYSVIRSGDWCGGEPIAALATVDRTGLSGDELVAVSVSGLVGIFRDVEDSPMAVGWPANGVATGGGRPPTRLRWVMSGDVDRSDAGTPEIVVADSSGTFHLLSSVGRELPGWPVSLGATLAASPILGDVDGDGRLEIVAADTGGRVHVLRSIGAPLATWPRAFGAGPNGASEPGTLILCDAAPPEGREVISYRGSGDLREPDGGGAAGPWSVPLGAPPGGGPIALDLDRDGLLEIAAVDSSGRVHVVRTERAAGRGDGDWRLAGFDIERRGSFPNSRLPEIRVPEGLLPEASVACYPNPAPGNELFVHYALGRPAEVSLELFDMAGERVASRAGTSFAGEDNTVGIPLSGLASGFYVLRIRAAERAGTVTVMRKVAVLR